MSHPPGKKERTRQRILQAAARLFARQGYAATSIDAVMQACGLTRGGFYAHFGSKGELFRQALGDGGPARLEAQPSWHFLAKDVASRQVEVREAYTQALRSVQCRLQAAPQRDPGDGDTAWASTALLVGALAITLTVDDAKLKWRVARACRRAARLLQDSRSELRQAPQGRQRRAAQQGPG